MGKPYATELDRLPETYAWAMGAPIDRLAAAVSTSASLPLLAIGSGGSLTAAHIACGLHQTHAGVVARPLTPLEFVSSSLYLGRHNVMLLSAGGNNADIVSALQNAAIREPRRCLAFCLRRRSRLSRLAEAYRLVDLIEDLNPPTVKDGFLATNSLLAFSVLLVRAYAHAFSVPDSLPPRLEDLVVTDRSFADYCSELRAACKPLWKRETLVVLYGSQVHAAAVDLESKSSEAALGNTQIADFRNFAHGRHHWLAKRGSTSGVFALYGQDDRDLAERTLRLIPPTMPIVRVCLPGTGSVAAIGALVAGLHVIGAAGEQRGIDPGRPGVPMFGRRIYGLRGLRGLSKRILVPDSVAISRKLRCDISVLATRRDMSFWGDSFRKFTNTLQAASFAAVIFDYDGTLCDERDRFSGLRPETVQQLARFLRAGILVGMATGRGRSVRDDVREALPRKLWASVYLGYYNGSDIGVLSDDTRPDAAAAPCDSIKEVAARIAQDPIISRVATCEPRHAQVSVQPGATASADFVWRRVQQLAHSRHTKVLRSSHSIDLLAHSVSKLSLLAHLKDIVPKAKQVLVIGDKGQWPGNDHELLSTPFSLSVDEVSGDPDACWNLAPPGYRGVQAVLHYLRACQVSKRAFRINAQKLMAQRVSGGRR